MYGRDSTTQSILDLINNPADKIKQQPKPPYREAESVESAEENIAQKTLEEIYRPSDAIPSFAYPFKRRSNTATKTKSDQEIFEEILFKDKTAQYLFNSSGLFHGGVHLKAEEFEMDFEIGGIRAIADGELLYYRIDKKYLKNTLEDTFNEFDVLYSSGFFLLEHKMEYPKGNKLKFYSLYMHTAPSYEYEFEEYMVMGKSAFARKTSDNSKADEFVKFGDKVVLGKPIANKDGRYELLTVNGIKMPSGYNVHISNLQYEAVVTTVTGSEPNMREGNTLKSLIEGLLKDKSSITIHPYQTEEQKKNKRYKVIKAIKADGTPAVVSSKSTISASNIKAKIPEVNIYTKNNNGIVQPHMKKMAGSNLKPASKDFKVKAGEELGKLGVYNSEWYETELDKVVHLEVFTFDDLKGFIEKSQEEYKKDPKDLSDEEKKLRPKENLFVVPQDEKELFILDDSIYGVSNRNTKIRKGMIQSDAEYKIAPSGTELELSSNKNSKRQQVKEWVGETLEANITYSVHIAHVDFYKKFIPIPQESEVLTKSIRKSPSKLKILKDKDKNEYVCIDENIRLYVKNKKEYLTHGITFSNFTLIDEAGADKIGIFEDVSKYYEKKTEEDKTPQQEKEKLNDTFKAILQKIKVDKNKDGKLEAGEFASLSLTKEKRKELSYMMVKHESEWEDAKDKFQPILDYLDQDPKQEKNKKMFEDRLEKLALFPKDLVGKGKTPTFIHPIALVEGFVGGSKKCKNDINLGTLSSFYETGGRGTVTVSGGVGDYGGVSYGAYQLTSKPHGGNVKKFVNWDSFLWSQEFNNLTPGSSAFTNKWKELVSLHGTEFTEIEHEYIKLTHFDIQCNKIKKSTQIEIRCHSHTLNDVIWSTAVHLGPSTSAVIKAISKLEVSYEQTKAYDEVLIKAIYKERGKTKSNGDLAYFSKNSKDVQKSVADRFVSESKKAIKRLKNENY